MAEATRLFTPSTGRAPARVQPAQPLLLLHLGALCHYGAGPGWISLVLPARIVGLAPATAPLRTLANAPGQVNPSHFMSSGAGERTSARPLLAPPPPLVPTVTS